MNKRQKKSVALISVHGDPAIEIGCEEAGGQNVYVRQVGEALAQRGWQVDMFTRASNAKLPKIVDRNRNCRIIRLSAGPEKFIPRQEIFSYRYDFIKALLEFQERSGKKYSLVHANYWISGGIGLELKKKLSVPMVHTYHSLGAVKYKSVSTIPTIAKTRLAVEKACLETANYIVATSPQEKEHMRSLVSKKGNIVIIPCGTDIDLFGSINRGDARASLGMEPDDRIVLYLGRFDKRKGIENLVRAVAKSKWSADSRLKLIIGGGSTPGRSDGIERKRIEEIVKELGLWSKTQFPGRISDRELPLYYAAADVCAVPSHYEPFGLVAIEAMASRTPVIASKVGGLQFSIVDGETGLLVSLQNEEAFTLALDRILGDRQLAQQLGLNGRKRVENKFSWNEVASELNDLYLQAIEENHVSLAS